MQLLYAGVFLSSLSGEDFLSCAADDLVSTVRRHRCGERQLPATHRVKKGACSVVLGGLQGSGANGLLGAFG